MQSIKFPGIRNDFCAAKGWRWLVALVRPRLADLTVTESSELSVQA